MCANWNICPLASTRQLTDHFALKNVFTLPFYLVDEEMMSTEVTPPSSSELTELGKCLMKQEVSKLNQRLYFKRWITLAQES